ncbi:MAG: ABC transporter substrate-binding protein, partial [Candidatus Puniceispirillales bacterium]
MAITAALLAVFTASLSADLRSDATIGLQLEPPHLDPTSAAAGAIDQVLYANVYEGLTRFTEHGDIIPQLAKSWDISDNGRLYQFTLHAGITFHDGTILDAAAVKFSLDRARSETSINAQKALFKGIADITVNAP